MADVFAEIDEVMRQDRAERFWKENGRTLIVAVILSIVLTAAISGYRGWNTHVQEKQTDALLSALDVENPAEGLIKASEDLRPGLRGIALLNAGSAYLKDDKKEEALKAYSQAADDGAIPNDLRELAQLMVVNLTPATAENKDALLKKLKDVSANEKSPWRFHAHLVSASILAHTAQDYKGAQEELKTVIAAEEIAPSLKAKAQALSQVYALEAAKAPKKSAQP